MATTVSKFTNNLTPKPRRGQIKINAVKIMAKSLQNLAIQLAGKPKKKTGNGGSNAGELKSASKHNIKQIRPKRGDVKIRIFKLIAKSVKDFAIWVAGKEKKAAGDGGGGGCLSAPAAVIPLETVGRLKADFEYEIKQTELLNGEIEIDICKVIASIFQIPADSGGKKMFAGGAWAGIIPVGLESENGCDYNR